MVETQRLLNTGASRHAGLEGPHHGLEARLTAALVLFLRLSLSLFISGDAGMGPTCHGRTAELALRAVLSALESRAHPDLSVYGQPGKGKRGCLLGLR